MDEQKNLYAVDAEKSQVRKYRSGDTIGTRIAGGNESGSRLD